MSDENRELEKRVTTKLILSTIMLLATITSLILLYTGSCSVGPKEKIVEQQPAPNPTPDPNPNPNPTPQTCADGSAYGATRDVACPQGQVGKTTQVCSALGWKDVASTCQGQPPKPCDKKIFADVLPVLQTACASCHAAITTYATAQSWSSEISRRVALPTSNNDHMPQGTAPQLSQDQIYSLQKWVSDGAQKDCASVPQQGSTVTLDYINTAMLNDAASLSPADRPNTRYLITAGAINGGVTGEALQVWVGAMNKALNSLNPVAQDTFKVQSIEPTQSVWRVDLRTFAIDAKEIALIEAGDININIVDQTSKGVALQALIGSKKPWFHADNFVDVTFRNSNVYYTLLNVPAHLVDLQKLIGVDFARDLADLDANFIGSASSPIAEQKNRLIARVVEDRSQDAYYWQTFDVNAVPANVVVNGQVLNAKNLFQFPLLTGSGAGNGGIASIANFVFDASETIWLLPNGLQAYGLWDGVGNRVNFADPNIVIDTATPLGNKVINNANSCSRCHNGGTIPFQDQILASVTANAAQFNANDVALVKKLYQAAAVDSAIFRKDNSVYARALIKIGVDPNKPDPMNVITDRFLQNWDLAQAAGFLFLTPEQFIDAVNTSPTAKAQIGQILTGGSVPFGTFIGVLQQLIADARLFQDGLGN